MDSNLEILFAESGMECLEKVQKDQYDLILLDINMPGMDGFEALKRLRELEAGKNETPVIFLTADENEASETKGLSLGAMDFVKKPFIPDVLALRVRHIIDLNHLQQDLSKEVEKKTKENADMFLHIVEALADAIDAKDTYTNGHSGRVATYSREIAHRFGFSPKREENIYMMGLLHDIGKIGVPDAIINKPARLNDEEYNTIKMHTVMGAKILKNIVEMPLLVTGARYHHERYDGHGYPDGLSRSDIPEEARIIAVADAYDAMSSRRSYRGIMSQETVREEIVKGKGTQFDPVFADIMLKMIDEDKDYSMREH